LENGCIYTSWEGTDPEGITGYPSLSTINCPEETEFDENLYTEDNVRFFLRSGSAKVNNITLEHISDAYWVAEGIETTLKMTGPSFIYAVGKLSSKGSTVE
jgi:hypothetical protein